MVTRFQFKNKKYRQTTDLRQYEDDIIRAIYEVIDKSIEVRVMSQYYEIETNVSSNDARKIGRKISFYSPELRKLRTTYVSNGKKISRQIFVRMVIQNA